MLQYCFRSYVRAYETQSHAHKIAMEGNVGGEAGRYTTQRGPEGEVQRLRKAGGCSQGDWKGAVSV